MEIKKNGIDFSRGKEFKINPNLRKAIILDTSKVIDGKVFDAVYEERKYIRTAKPKNGRIDDFKKINIVI